MRQVEDYYLTDESAESRASGVPEPKMYKRVPTTTKDYYRPLAEEAESDSKDAKLIKNFVASVEHNTLPPVEEPVIEKERKRKMSEVTPKEEDEEKEEDVAV